MPGSNAERDARIVAAARLGQTHDAIAAEHGITRTRVSQIVHAADPRSPDEVSRQLIAARLRQKWDELQRIVDHPPEQHSAIGKIVVGSDGAPVINVSAVVQAIRAQLTVEAQFRAMFGVDLGASLTMPREQATRACDAVLAELREQRAAELRELAAARVALPAPYIHAEVITS